MSAADLLHDFSFEEDTHTYRNAQGTVRPSVTGILKELGIFDYSHIEPAVLERKRRIGSNIHRWTAAYDRGEAFDEDILPEDEKGYFAGWQRFRRESRFTLERVAEPILNTIMGVELGGRPDRTGTLGKKRYVVDLKTSAARHPAWALQLALYEMLLTGIPRCGHLGRMVVQLFPDGNYEIFSLETPSDAGAALSAVMLAVWKQNHGIRTISKRDYVTD